MISIHNGYKTIFNNQQLTPNEQPSTFAAPKPLNMINTQITTNNYGVIMHHQIYQILSQKQQTHKWNLFLTRSLGRKLKYA